MAGTSFLMFWFRFIPEMFLQSQPPFCAVGHFVCFSARLAIHYYAAYSVLAS